jgi:hypothetical protein
LADKQKFLNIVTPAGSALWCKIFVPDTKYKAEGEYSTKMVLPADEAGELIDILKEEVEIIWNETIPGLKPAVAKQMARSYPFTDELDEETGDETGNLIFKFTTRASYKKKDGSTGENSVALFDASGKAIPKGASPRIGNGSLIKVSATVIPFSSPGTKKIGVSLRLRAVQLVQLEEYAGGDGGSYGFGASDGYTYKPDESGPDAGGEANDEDVPF